MLSYLPTTAVITSFVIFILLSCHSQQSADKPQSLSKEINSAPPSRVSQPETSGPETASKTENALRFLNLYVENDDKLRNDAEVVEFASSSGLTTKSFNNELKRIYEEGWKKNPEMGVDADLIFDAQDCPDAGFTIESFDENTNMLVVRGIDWPEFKLTAHVVKENGKWLMDGCGMVNIPEEARSER